MKRRMWLWTVPLLCAGGVSGCTPVPEPTSSRGEAGSKSALYNALTADAAGALAPAPCDDTDKDGLCNEDEATLGTDPLLPDTDGDSLDDGLEVNGYTVGAKTLDLKALGANPRKRDIFLEIDYMKGWQPLSAAVEDVKRAFAAAPVMNHDGTSGIQLHVEVSDEIPLIAKLADWPEAELATMKGAYFDDIRSIAFHYAVFGERYGSRGSSGMSMGIGAADFIVTLGGHEANLKATPQEKQAGTLMHELGHNLGLHHGGQEDTGRYSDTPYQPHYLSVMNYTYQFYGVRRNSISVLDFARSPVRALDETNVDEVAAFSLNRAAPDAELVSITFPMICVQRTGAGSQSQCHKLEALFGSAGKDLDLNRSGGTIQATPVSADLDGDGKLGTLPGLVEEWNKLNYRGGGIIGQRTTLRRRDVVPSEPVYCEGPLDIEVVTASAEATPTEPEQPQLPVPPAPAPEPQSPPEQPVPPEEQPQSPPDQPPPTEDQPQWPEEPVPAPEQAPQWPLPEEQTEQPLPPPEEPVPSPDDEPQWPEGPEYPAL